MSLDAHIIDPHALIDPATGELDAEFSASLGMEEHETLFALPEMHSGQFPLLLRMRDHDADVEYESSELEALILEVELAASLLGADSPLIHFTGPFHSLCCVAWSHGKGVALHVSKADDTTRFPLVEGARPIMSEDVARLRDEA